MASESGTAQTGMIRHSGVVGPAEINANEVEDVWKTLPERVKAPYTPVSIEGGYPE